MILLSFHQTKAEFMVRVASTLLFETLTRNGSPAVALADLTEKPQYGFTASATDEPVGPRFVRITDLQDGRVEWDKVPYCSCPKPKQYRLVSNDLLFARTGATTGKTYLVSYPQDAIYASYLIRVRTKTGVDPRYLYAFFQSDTYWRQIVGGKEGSAQPNVNGKKLAALRLPQVNERLQQAIAEFLTAVRQRQDGDAASLPALPAPLAEQRRIVAKIEQLTAKIDEARGLRGETSHEAGLLWRASASSLLRAIPDSRWKPVANIVEIHGGGTPSKKNPAFWGGDVPWVCPRDMKRRNIHDSTDHITDAAVQETNRRLIDPGSVLVVVRGMILAHTAPAAVLRVRATINQDMKALTPRDDVTAEYLCSALWALNPELLALVERSGHDTRKLLTDRLLSFAVPVPPLEEQHRIVAYLDGLQAKVDRLKALQEKTATELDALLPSILDKAFKGEL